MGVGFWLVKHIWCYWSHAILANAVLFRALSALSLKWKQETFCWNVHSSSIKRVGKGQRSIRFSGNQASPWYPSTLGRMEKKAWNPSLLLSKLYLFRTNIRVRVRENKENQEMENFTFFLLLQLRLEWLQWNCGYISFDSWLKPYWRHFFSSATLFNLVVYNIKHWLFRSGFHHVIEKAGDVNLSSTRKQSLL